MMHECSTNEFIQQTDMILPRIMTTVVTANIHTLWRAAAATTTTTPQTTLRKRRYGKRSMHDLRIKAELNFMKISKINI